MTRKDYQLIADALNKAYRTLPEHPKCARSKVLTYHTGQFEAFQHTYSVLVEALGEANPDFNPGTFYAAVYRKESVAPA